MAPPNRPFYHTEYFELKIYEIFRVKNNKFKKNTLTFSLLLKSKSWNSHVKDVLPILEKKIAFYHQDKKVWSREFYTDLLPLFIQPNTKASGFHYFLGLHFLSHETYTS